jgi:cytochrome P450 family 6
MSFQSLFFYFILPAVIICFIFLRKRYSFFKDRGVIHVKPSWLFGNMKGVGTTHHVSMIVKEFYNKNHNDDIISGFYNFIQPIYLINDLDVVKSVLIKDFNTFVNRGGFMNEKNEPITANLFGVESDHWRFLRNKLSPAFTSGKIKLMFEVMKSKGGAFAEAIEKKSKSGSVDVKEIAHRYTIDTISAVAFGMEANTLNGGNLELHHYSKEAFGAESASPIKMFLMFSFPKLAKIFNFRQFSKVLSDYFYQVIGENIKYREKSGEKRNDFLNMLVELKNKGSIDGEVSKEAKKLTIDQCVAQGFIFIIGGSDTSSSTISAAVAEIAKNPEIQEKLRAEIFEKTKKSNGEITYENLQEMTYLQQVMNG